ncbi:hypothetical protein ABT187_21755 [Streptomyces sp. NPDC001817]|uniref:hypothetical protein n=1 Tax=Streptomyces sp. NPDC001817 TaxID=3154398 RepID=UPI00332DEC20
MRQLSKAAAAAAVIASVSFIATGTATTAATAATAATARGAVVHRGGCIDILGEVGIANGIAGNLLNGEGNPGAQFTDC